MKVRILSILLPLLFCLTSTSIVFAEGSLQQKIDAAPANSTLILSGEYNESVVITKPLIMIGEEGTIIRSCKNKPVITLQGDQVSLKNIGIDQDRCKEDQTAPAMHISGKNHSLENITINTENIGIKMENAELVTMQSVEVNGNYKNNGIDLAQSNKNTFTNVFIQDVADGFYVEDSHENKFIANTIEYARYGLHIMFSNDIVIKDNLSRKNDTGAMVMETKGTIVAGNTFSGNNQNVNSQGLLLYSVEDTQIRDNQISGNRLGIYAESTFNSTITENEISNNFIGMQLQSSQNNLLSINSFLGNVTDMQTIESQKNRINNNFWDQAIKLDSDGDGWSNIPYSSDPFFLSLTKDATEYQLFFQSPGMLVLQRLLKSPEDKQLSDLRPALSLTVEQSENPKAGNEIIWIVCLVMILTSLLLLLIGRNAK